MITSSAGSAGDVVFWCLVLVFGIAVLGTAILALRRRLFGTRESAQSPVWSLQHLRDLRSAGEITEDEFKSLREKMIGEVGRRKDGRSAGAAPDENAKANHVKQAPKGSR